MLGYLPVLIALHAHAIAGVVANYVAHAWLAAIALSWYFVLRRRFPIGGFDQRQLRPWYLLGLALVAVNAVGTVASPPSAGVRLPAMPTLVAELVFVAFVVGPTEELLFRGLIQTALNGSIRSTISLRGWSLRWGTVVAAVVFGLFHLINLAYQPLGDSVVQIGMAVVLGLLFGVIYDRTRNLIGASLAHSLADFSGTAIPLVAWCYCLGR